MFIVRYFHLGWTRPESGFLHLCGFILAFGLVCLLSFFWQKSKHSEALSFYVADLRCLAEKIKKGSASANDFEKLEWEIGVANSRLPGSFRDEEIEKLKILRAEAASKDEWRAEVQAAREAIDHVSTISNGALFTGARLSDEKRETLTIILGEMLEALPQAE